MDLTSLTKRVRAYTRDTAGKRFPVPEIAEYINEGIDRLRSYHSFADMPYIDDNDDIYYLPEQYHYILALYAAARCFAVDLDHYQEQQKRNEFENLFSEIITMIENGKLTIYDLTGSEVDVDLGEEVVSDVYFDVIGGEEQ